MGHCTLKSHSLEGRRIENGKLFFNEPLDGHFVSCLVGLKPDLQCGIPGRSGFSPTLLLVVGL